MRHLPRTHSDHTPLLLILQPPRIAKSNIFRFETIWTSHPDFIHILHDSWHPSPSLLDDIEQFQHNIQNWNKQSFGNLFHKKRRLLARLEVIQSSPNFSTSFFLQDLKDTL